MVNLIHEKKINESSKLLTEYLAFLQNHQCVAQSIMGIRRNYGFFRNKGEEISVRG